MKHGCVQVWFGLLILVLVGTAFPADTATPAKKSNAVGHNEQIKFDQDKAQAHMRELEERMFRLAKLIRDDQPEEAARLLMGVRQAREHLIAERMTEVSSMLTSLRLDPAISEQKEIVEKLEELKKLLLTANLGLELKLEQLRKLREARERLERLIKKEQSQLEQTTELSKLSQRPDDDFASLLGGERRNQRAGEDLEQLLREFGSASAKACRAMGGACSSMGQASERLTKSDADDATNQQQDAVKQLQEAFLETEQLEEQLRKEVESLARQQVLDNLRDMLTQQCEVREMTERLAPRVAEGHAPAILSVKRLAAAEDRIVALADSSIELCELSQCSLVLPMALGAVKEMMIHVSERLDAGRANEELIADERQIEADLKALLDALKQASLPGSNSPGSCCSQCGGNKFKLLAEVRMLRWMEHALNVKTRSVDEQLQKEQPEHPQRQERAKPLGVRQAEIRRITDRLHDLTCPHCLAEESG